MNWKDMIRKIAAMTLTAGLCGGMLTLPANAEEIGPGIKKIETETEAETVPETEQQTEPEAALGAFYNGFFYGNGWGTPRGDNELCTLPGSGHLTAVKATLSNQPQGMGGTLAYQVNLSGSGWLDWVENDAVMGTVEMESPIEAVKMKLTGDLAKHYDVYYSVLQYGTWSEWVKNEEISGVEGQGIWLYGLRVSIVAKGAEAPPLTPAVTGVDPARPMVALTFDDGPSTEVTNRILDSLEAHGGKATFFMVGNRVSGTAATVSRMVSLGCEVGNHTYEHKYLPNLGDAGIRTSVGQTNTLIANASGVTPVLMRPTGGYYNDASLATLGSMGMSAVMWSIDTRDWQHRNPQKTIDSVLNHVKDGDIILMHDIYGTTADAAQAIIPELTARGYQLVTVSEMAAVRGGMAPGHVYNSFRP